MIFRLQVVGIGPLLIPKRAKYCSAKVVIFFCSANFLFEKREKTCMPRKKAVLLSLVK